MRRTVALQPSDGEGVRTEGRLQLHGTNGIGRQTCSTLTQKSAYKVSSAAAAAAAAAAVDVKGAAVAVVAAATVAAVDVEGA
jgi:hypothetical protein